MLPSKFVELAGFPDRWQERDLQKYLGDRLTERGFTTHLEAPANGGRADIVSNWQGGVIAEVKKYLDRDTIYQAVGQLNLYGLNNTHKLVVMGFLTPDARAQPSALKTASMVEQNPRVQVVFVNLDEEWLPGSRVAHSWFPQLFSLPKLSLPQLHFGEWRWWLGVAKDNPLLLVLALALVFVTTDQLKREFTQCQQQKQLLNCLFSENSPRP
ncbi:hypothetical protein FNW02_31360 [Komarekiella sp. 'clone 1']|uniref:Uncharacterized protein n=1 Tax=Komarekiella delphini-convector SJRDD-AB1 TaxID=2593771 RepID=A0AA40T3B8_9NOST|nr:hypothetical protein [Komarekiella delphini-convector]MBD6620171.1 hypothetical protein [Komarekiella delphini-convector SJRDD-AB1]